MAGMRLMRVSRQVSRAAFCPLRAAGLTTSQFAVIAKIGASEGIAQQELAGSLSVTQGNTSQLLAKLEARGPGVRPQGGRRTRLFRRDGGRRLYEEVAPAHEARISEQSGVLSASERNQLLGLLQK